MIREANGTLRLHNGNSSINFLIFFANYAEGKRYSKIKGMKKKKKWKIINSKRELVSLLFFHNRFNK